MEPNLVTQCRYSLCRMQGDQIAAIVHADDLDGVATAINIGPRSAWYMAVDRSHDARIADDDAQWVPSLGAYMVALFEYQKVDLPIGIGSGNSRVAGRFAARLRMTHSNPMTVARVERHIAEFYERLASVCEPAAAAV